MHLINILVSILVLQLQLPSVLPSVFDNEVDDYFEVNEDGKRMSGDDNYNYDDAESMKVTKYDPTWASLDSRPIPPWYDEVKIGIMICWGVYSVPAYGGAWFWHSWATNRSDIVRFMNRNYPPSFTYQDFGPQFTAQFYNATEWVELFQKAGAKYVVLTAKHHEGYTLWPSKYSFGWNSMDVGPKKDLVGELAAAVKKSPLVFGLYHSLYEWYNPLYLQDKANGYKTRDFVDFKTMPELYELVNTYEPEVIWSDGDWEASPEYWKSTEFLAWLYNESPVKDTVVVNDRWGIGASCVHGDFHNCRDRYNPHKLQGHKWENAFTVDKNYWEYRIGAVVSDYLTINELIDVVVPTISCGGNVLLNVGPTKEGTIIPIMQERLLELGQWLGVNGDAIYGSKPWKAAQNDSESGFVWYTSKPADQKLYALVLRDLTSSLDKMLRLGSVKVQDKQDIVRIGLLGYPLMSLTWEIATPADKGIWIHMPSFADLKHVVKSGYGWTIVITFKDKDNLLN